VTIDCGSDRTIRITVSDAGPGFDASERRFGGESGGGLGLFGIRERLALMGGRLDVASAPGAGSRLTLTAPVPCTAAAAEPGSAAPPAEAAPAEPAPAARRRRRAVPAKRRKAGDVIGVLIADDHAMVREGLTRLLKQEKDIRIVGEAADGFEAVAMTRALRPDVVLMDVSMPTLDGIEATRRIRTAFPDVGVIGLSMFEDEEHAGAMLDAGANAYLTKSGPSRTLVSAIRRVFRRPVRARRMRAPATGRRRRMP
jgi:CheY-like chemotaxis protein